MREHWAGTVILLFQPNEERSGGAQQMVDDRLYERIPIPDVLLAQHVSPKRAGWLGMNSGVQLSASETLKITLHGRGGHASSPVATIDPIVMMASCILRLQTIVSRELDVAHEFAVVTIGQASAGNAPNIIPDTATFHVNVRTVDEIIRARVMASIKRIVTAESDASNAAQAPTIEIISAFPVTYNSPKITYLLGHVFETVFGGNFKPNEFPQINASDDFSILARAIARPYCYWMLGGTDPVLFDSKDEREIPWNHSSSFAPIMQPTIKVATDAMTAAALTFVVREVASI